MKVIFISVLFSAVTVFATAGDDPFATASRALPQQHSHVTTPAVPPLTLAELEQIALQANPEIRLAAHKVATAEAHVSGAGALEDQGVGDRHWLWSQFAVLCVRG
jgi:hypothetical protein